VDVTLPDGTQLHGVPEGTTKAQLAEKLKSNGVNVPDHWLSPSPAPDPSSQPYEGPLERAGHAVSEAVGEPTLKAVTGAAGSIAGGVGGLVRGGAAAAGTLVAGGSLDQARTAFQEEGTRTLEGVQQAVTREPRTKIGQATEHVVTYPFALLAKGAQRAGAKTAEVTGSPAAGAAVNTVIQALPAAVFPAARALRGAGAAEELSATAAPRSAPSDVGGDVPRGTSNATPSQAPPEAPGAAQGPTRPTDTPQSPNEARARSYAERIGLDWTRLGAGTRKALASIAQDAKALERLSPDAVKRQAHLESLRVPVRATRGQLERDPVQLRREAIASNTSEGQPIRDTDIAANAGLQANLEVLRGRVGGRRGNLEEGLTEAGTPNEASIRAPTKTPSQVGESAQGAAREKAKWSKKGYQALYKAARETEPDAQVPLDPVQKLLTENPEIQHLGWVSSWLNKARSVLPKDAEGNAPELTQAKLAELHDLRSKANDIARTGGKEGYYAGQVVKAIDETMQNAPEGAAAWKRANEAFRAHQREFKDQSAISKLVNQSKAGGDRAQALEQTWKKVATGPLEQVRQVKSSLMTGGTPATRMAGRRAWRDIRAETVNRILEDARNVTAADETERAILTEAALLRSIKRIPRENLEEILGKANTRELYDVLRARRITTRSPVGGRTTQSGTVPNALVLAERVLKHIPGVKYVLGAKHAIAELGERGAAGRAAKEATITPLEKAAQDVERSRPSFSKERRAAQYRAIEGTGPTLAPASPQPTIADAVRRPPP
jgi:hypothetical protein